MMQSDGSYKNLKISVLIPCFNSEEYLGETLSSVIKQDLKPAEVVIVDDASTDETIILAESWRGRYENANVGFNLIKLPVNLGNAAARNAGIKQCRFDHVAMIDSDDVAKPEWLKSVVGVFADRPEVIAVGGGGEIIDKDGKKTKAWAYCEYSGDVTHLARKGVYPFLQPGSVFKKDALFKVGMYNVDLKGSQDQDLFLSLSFYGNLQNLGRPLVYYRKLPSSASNFMPEYRRKMASFLEKKRGALEKGCSVQEANALLQDLLDEISNTPRIASKKDLNSYYLEMAKYYGRGGMWAKALLLSVKYSFKSRRPHLFWGSAAYCFSPLYKKIKLVFRNN